ncbi:MAG: non-canonical purine NTP pyrophosphatase [Candidatus Pacebacteria bacterium]|nr:non-canonical purine NTP pyrophosphatase [Candidatus Paceibacterota bacterium]
MDIVLSTRNPSKAPQIQTLFGDSSIRVHTLDELGIEGEVVEDGMTLEENSTKKAVFAHERANGSWAMADDSGLFINALNGVPGVNAAYWAGMDVPTEVTTQYCIDQMAGLEDRTAIFRVVVVVISPEGERYVFDGEVEGSMLEGPRVPPQPKMPYSPLFVPRGETRSWAEMSTEEGNAISHRGIAFRKVKEFLEGIPQ